MRARSGRGAIVRSVWRWRGVRRGRPLRPRQHKLAGSAAPKPALLAEVRTVAVLGAFDATLAPRCDQSKRDRRGDHRPDQGRAQATQMLAHPPLDVPSRPHRCLSAALWMMAGCVAVGRLGMQEIDDRRHQAARRSPAMTLIAPRGRLYAIVAPDCRRRCLAKCTSARHSGAARRG